MSTQKIYDELARWWPLMSPPAEYAEEAEAYCGLLTKACRGPATSLLELGSGGGNNASHLKRAFSDIVLVDRSEGMLAHSRELNPECVHVVGDMRDVRLARTFDCVFVHDAICYMQTLADLRRVVDTAFLHCRPGGSALFAPDYLRETFAEETDEGGVNGPSGEGLRFLAWIWDPDPSDTEYLVDYAYLLRSADGSVRVEHDRHVEGLFSRAEWLATIEDAGFTARSVPLDLSSIDPGRYEVFVAARPT